MDKPFVFKEGKRKGKSIERMMLEDYSFLVWYLGRIRELKKSSSQGRLEKHLEWIISKGETRTAVVSCRFCQERPIEYFSIRYSYASDFSVSMHYTACKDCKHNLRENNTIILPLKFSSLKNLKREKKEVVSLFKEAFGLKGLRKEGLFRFFKS